VPVEGQELEKFEDTKGVIRKKMRRIYKTPHRKLNIE
jgi:hypothetical protein